MATTNPSRTGIPASATGAIIASAFTMSTAKLLGRTTAGTGAIEEISAGSGLALSAGSLTSNVTLGANTFTGAQRGAFVTLTDAATIALNLALANQYFVVIGGDRTLGTPTNIVAGQQGVINVRQDATGSHTLAYAWPYEWAGGSAGVLSTPGCTRDMLAYSVDFYHASTATITIAAPGVITATAHGMATGQKFQLTTTGALPTGLTASTTYYASVVGVDSINVCASLADAAAGTFITTTGTQSGVHTLTACSISLQLAKAFA